jgi:hypothetical protein
MRNGVTGVDLDEELLANARAPAPTVEFLARAAGQARTRREHTFRRRLRELVESLEARI